MSEASTQNILYGTPATPPTGAELVEALNSVADYDEADSWTSQIIRQYMLPPELRQKLNDLNVDVTDLLNGNVVEERGAPDPYEPFFSAWNAQLGQNYFHF